MDRLPDFIIIGAAKCGTTTLYKKLIAHPNIFMSTPKEPEFFARDENFKKGIDWYKSLFQGAQPGQLCGEASTLYSLTSIFPETVKRMHAAVPDAKLIYVVREPVERAYSYYTQLLKNYQNRTQSFSVNRTFDECLFPEQFPGRCPRELFFAAHDTHLPDEPRTFIDGSRYMANINNYLSLFDRSQLLLVDFEDLVKKPNEVMDSVCNFLGINSQEISGQAEVRENISKEHFARADKQIAKQRIVNAVKNNPLGQLLFRITPKSLRQKAAELYASFFGTKENVARPPKMSADAEKYLTSLFKQEVEELERFWQRDLPSWKRKSET